MIDIHCHLLPSVDDGPKSWEDSLQMCKKAVADGVTHIVATPHCNNRYVYDRQASAAKLDELRSRFLRCKFSLGCELAISTSTLAEAQSRPSLYTIENTQYLLVEINPLDLPEHTLNALSQLTSAGLLPIIAHPERNPLLQRRIDLVVEWRSFGCLTAVTAGSIMGFWGPRCRKASEALLRRNLVDVIVSDAHDPDRRPPILSASRNEAAKILGKERAARLVFENPARILRSQSL